MDEYAKVNDIDNPGLNAPGADDSSIDHDDVQASAQAEARRVCSSTAAGACHYPHFGLVEFRPKACVVCGRSGAQRHPGHATQTPLPKHSRYGLRPPAPSEHRLRDLPSENPICNVRNLTHTTPTESRLGRRVHEAH